MQVLPYLGMQSPQVPEDFQGFKLTSLALQLFFCETYEVGLWQVYLFLQYPSLNNDEFLSLLNWYQNNFPPQNILKDIYISFTAPNIKENSEDPLGQQP